MKEAKLTVDLKDNGNGSSKHHPPMTLGDDIDLETGLTLRDKLALDRTLLAKERTTLSYIRTGLTFLGVALFIVRFYEGGFWVRAVGAAVFALPGAYAVIRGMKSIFHNRNWRKDYEQNYMAVKKKWNVKSTEESGHSGRT
jgi:hypothetical protein